MAALMGALVVLIVIGGMVLAWHLGVQNSEAEAPPVRMRPDMPVAVESALLEVVEKPGYEVVW